EEDGEVLGPGHQVRTHLRGIVGLEQERRAGKRCAEVADQLVEMHGDEIALDADAHRQDAAGVADRMTRLGPGMEQCAGMGSETEPRGREFRSRARTTEKPLAERPFQSVDAARDRRLRHREPVGGAVEAPWLGEVEEGLYQLDLHWRP